jgi:hypothetical protein
LPLPLQEVSSGCYLPPANGRTLSKADSIQKKVALFLLVVFALSITPKVVFHEVLAEHKDSLLCQDKDKTAPHFHLPAFHCSFDDLVVTSPYLSIDFPPAPERPVFFKINSFGFFTFASSFSFLHRESRGPPLM